jgi:hypothetical protein
VARPREQDHVFVESLGLGGRHGSVKARAPPATRVTVERELTDDEEAATNFAERAVHFALSVFENAKTDDLVDQVPRVGFAVAFGDPDESNHAVVDTPYDVSADLDSRAGDALDDGAHQSRKD